jgi:peptide/nickel transport system permease protein
VSVTRVPARIPAPSEPEAALAIPPASATDGAILGARGAPSPPMQHLAALPPRRGRRRRSPLLGPLLALAGLALLFALGPHLWPADPLQQSIPARLRPPSLASPLGTDQLGRDVLARVLAGGRLTLGISLLVTLVTAVVGIAVGALAAARPGLLDALLTRIVDVLLAFPLRLLALAIAGLAGGGVWGIVAALGLFGWGTFARVARLEARRARSLPLVEAARALGAPPGRVFRRHVLPMMAGPLIVLAVARFAQVILTIAGLSFLGVGVQPPMPEWGAMLADGLPFMQRAPHLLLAPGLAVTLACLAVSLAGDALRRGLDPTTR